MKILLYVVIFVVFQTAVITLFALTIMKFKTPKFRVRSATFETFDVQSSSFNVRMKAELGVKNTNFGQFRYQNTTIEFYYRDVKVGEAFVDRARAKWRSTRKFNVTVDLRSANITGNSEITSDGILPLRAQSRLRGRVTIIVFVPEVTEIRVLDTELSVHPHFRWTSKVSKEVELTWKLGLLNFIMVSANKVIEQLFETLQIKDNNVQQNLRVLRVGALSHAASTTISLPSFSNPLITKNEFLIKLLVLDFSNKYANGSDGL
ncbi:hypothetical protein LguiA_031870 [Lonicera macranthoides]